MKNRGFTLIEILVVLVIIGVIISLATIAFTDDRGKHLEREARRFTAVLDLAMDEATLKSQTIGVQVMDREYAFYLYDTKAKEWKRIEDDRELRPRTLAEPMRLQLVLDGARGASSTPRDSEDKDKGVKPHLYLFSSGELTPAFEINVIHPELKGYYRIKGHEDGKLEFESQE